MWTAPSSSTSRWSRRPKPARPWRPRPSTGSGVCYYKKKNYAEANAAFQKLLRDYPDQKDLIASANKYLAGAVALMPAPWVDGEEMQLDIKFPTGFKIGAACYRVNAGETNGQKIWRLASRLYAVTQQSSRVKVEADSFKPIQLPLEDQRDGRGGRDLFLRPCVAEDDRQG